jgi:hypothetical protein
MLDDIFQSAKQNLLERLSSPFLGSFVISWCAWNWKFLVILFSDASVTGTFTLVDQVAFPNFSTALLRGILFPLISACVYVFLYPYPARYMYEFSLRRQREINQTKQRISEETPLTLEESRRLRTEYVEAERRHVEIVQRLNEEIARLNEAVEARGKKNELIPLTGPEKFYDKLDETQLELLRLLEKTGGESTETDLVQQSPDTRVKTEFNIGELERRKLISRNFSNRAKTYQIAFTHEGRRVLLESQRPSTGA